MMNDHGKKRASGKLERLEERIAPALLGGDMAAAFTDVAGSVEEIPEPVYETTLVEIDTGGTGPAGTEYTVQSLVTAEVGITTVEISGDSSLGIETGEQSASFTSHTDASFTTDPFTGETLIESDTTLTGPAGEEVTLHGEGTATSGEEGNTLSGTVTITGPNGQTIEVEGSVTMETTSSGTGVSTTANVTGPGGQSVTLQGATSVNADGTVETHSTTATNAAGQSFTFGKHA